MERDMSKDIVDSQATWRRSPFGYVSENGPESSFEHKKYHLNVRQYVPNRINIPLEATKKEKLQNQEKHGR